MKVTVLCQVYNSKPYIRKCIDSVLDQSFSDLDFLIIDNGCNDGTEIILKEYAAADKRINLIRFDENKVCPRYVPMLKDIQSEYFTNIDSDDWFENDYLERLVGLADKYSADIVTTGTHMRYEGSSEMYDRSSPDQLVIGKEDFPKYFPFYHQFFRTLWAKMIRMSAVRKSYLPLPEETNIVYGMDTVYSLEMLRHSNLIVIDNSILHNYRIHQKSASHQYDPRQSYSDLYLFNDALDFLKPYGPVSADNMLFLYCVYANAIVDTVTNIKNSTLSPEEKLSEYQKILARPETKNALSIRSNDTVNCKVFLISTVIETTAELSSENTGLCPALSKYFPECGNAVTPDSARLFLTEKPLFGAFFYDDKNALAENLLLMIEKQKYADQFDLGKILCALAQDKQLLDKIDNTEFIRQNGQIYRLIWLGKYREALDSMTDKLRKGSVEFEEFFEMYLTIAANFECAHEFVFGRIKQAHFYCDNGDKQKCLSILNEISEIGIKDNEEITEIKKKINSPA